MIRLVQLQGPGGRGLAIVEEPRLVLLEGFASVYDFAGAAIASARSAAELLAKCTRRAHLDYEAVYSGDSEWKILPAVDHPAEPARCFITGTGLTHMASAKNRDAMHVKTEELTDSMKMYRWGVEGGKPATGEIGVAPEWFYKGTGECLRAHNQALSIPEFSNDGGEEPEIAGVYINDAGGHPWRIGFAQGNEFSDHEFERKNYLYLAASKLRNCSIGPELLIGGACDSAPGTVEIERKGARFWSREIRSGESAMSHSIANLEHHHFKFEGHRRPGDVHVHFFGADAFSFGEGIRLETGDVMAVRFEGFGRALRNPLVRTTDVPRRVEVRVLEAGALHD